MCSRARNVLQNAALSDKRHHSTEPLHNQQNEYNSRTKFCPIFGIKTKLSFLIVFDKKIHCKLKPLSFLCFTTFIFTG